MLRTVQLPSIITLASLEVKSYEVEVKEDVEILYFNAQNITSSATSKIVCDIYDHFQQRYWTNSLNMAYIFNSSSFYNDTIIRYPIFAIAGTRLSFKFFNSDAIEHKVSVSVVYRKADPQNKKYYHYYKDTVNSLAPQEEIVHPFRAFSDGSLIAVNAAKSLANEVFFNIKKNDVEYLFPNFQNASAFIVSKTGSFPTQNQTIDWEFKKGETFEIILKNMDAAPFSFNFCAVLAYTYES